MKPNNIKELESVDRNKYFEYYCAKCGRMARMNTPVINDDGSIYCDTCVHTFDKLFRGVDQITLQPEDSYYYGEVVVHRDNNENECAWYNEGGTAFRLTEDEKAMPVERLIDKIRDMRARGYVRCTSCEKEIPEKDVAGRPLFAGINCKSCWDKHEEEVEQQRKNGKVCSMCRQPYLRCCC